MKVKNGEDAEKKTGGKIGGYNYGCIDV